MDKINIFIVNLNKTVEATKGISLQELLDIHYSEYKKEVLVARYNNEVFDLDKTIDFDCDVTFLTIKDKAGFKAYQTSALYLMITAIKEIYGREKSVLVKHSIGKNLYIEVDQTEFTDKDIVAIEKLMTEKVNQNIRIEKSVLSLRNAQKIFEENMLYDKLEVLKYRRGSSVTMYKLDWFYNYFYGALALDLSNIKQFKVSYIAPNLVLQVPDPEQTEQLAEIKDYPQIAKVFEEGKDWAELLGFDTVAKLNDKITIGKFNEVIRLSEELHEKKLSKIADKIKDDHKKLVLIAGPSSSGKTTFAHRLSDHLRVNGLKPHIISLDDYYLNRDEIPFDENGKQNFEVVESLDIEMINRDIAKIIAGEEVEIPSFNFKTGVKEYKGKKIKLEEKDIIVMEGIHGLNETITKAISKDDKFKIYISALTTLNIDNHNRIATTDTRLIRRLVRDYNSRGFGAKSTIEMWPTVLEGEVQNIFPYQNEADAVFNSALIYELSVLKAYVEPLLFSINPDEPEFEEARRIVRFLENFLTPHDIVVPPTSLCREFIGGGSFGL